MERLVHGISAINFHHYNEVSNENCAPNFIATTPASMAEAIVGGGGAIDFSSLPPVSIANFEMIAESVKNDGLLAAEKSDSEEQDHCNESDLNSSAETVTAEEVASTSSTRTSSRRKMPSRLSKQSNFFDKTKRRTISKPVKRTIADFTSLRPADIKKIYLNKKLTNFHPTKLETIFEEPEVDQRNAQSQVHFVGTRKVKRSLQLCDGFNINKTLIKQRRQKIKKTFGRRFALKKIPLDDFLHHLNRSFGEVDAVQCQKAEDGNATFSEERKDCEEMETV